MVPHTLKRLAAVGLAAALAVSLAACGKGGSTSSDSTDSSGAATLKLWTHAAGAEEELAATKQIVSDFNASQDKYTVEVQAFPQDSYNKSVTAAAASNSLPCILDIDGPNVPNWAWGGYLAPLDGMDEQLSKFLPSTVGTWNGKNYSAGAFDVALAMYARKSVLEKNNIRIPTIDQPWTGEEFNAALATLKATGEWTNPLDLGTGDASEWWPYAFSPMLQSFGGDLIDRTEYKSADGVKALDLGTGDASEWWPYAFSPMLQSFGGDLIDRTEYKSADGVLNGAEALAWATWFQSLVTDGYMPVKSGKDAGADWLNNKSAINWNGSWGAAAAREKFGDDALFLPPPDFGQGPKIGGGSWQWGLSAQCENPEGALEYLKFALQDKNVAAVAEAVGTVPATDGAAALVPGYEAGGVNDIFRQYAKEFAEVRPQTPGYPFIATTFTKAAQDIVNGGDPQAALDEAVAGIDANQQSNNYFQ